VSVTVTVESDKDLPPEVHVALYRITQEALNNVVKHAQASQVTVSLCKVPEDGRTVELRVSDDGKGFDPNCVSADHLGLGIMNERAQAIGATLQVDSQPGKGTRVVVVWKANEPRWTEDE
jgi:signal transduction histidine kinase